MIAWYDNVPVASYLLLRGRCRNCGKHISIRYPAVELLTGLLWFASVWKLGLTLAALKLCVFSAIIVALVFTDLEKRILPDELTKGGAVIGIAFALAVPLHDETTQGILWLLNFEPSGPTLWIIQAAVGAIVPAFFLWAGGWLYLKLRHKEGLGLGDVKLMIMIGAFLGLQLNLATLLTGSILGSLISLLYIWIAKKDASTYQLPFGTFLGAAALLIAFTN